MDEFIERELGTLSKRKYPKDITGVRFGSLVALRFSHRDKRNRALWLCQCDCGKVLPRRVDHLHSQLNMSCGCRKNSKFRKSKYDNVNFLVTRKVDASISRIYGNMKEGAKSRNIDFSIPLSMFKYLIFQECWYCGTKESNATTIKFSNGDYVIRYNGLDRVDSSLGYTLENVVPCCQFCNHAKMDRPLSVFLDWLESVKNSGRYINLLEISNGL